MKSAREKVIVLMAVLSVVLYGIYHLWGDAAEIPIPAGEPSAMDRLNAFVEEMNQDVKAGELSVSDHYILRRESEGWSDIFYRPEPPSEDVHEMVNELPEYSGYLEIGGHYFAIIGGDEYEVGNMLKNGMFKVISISPIQVIVESAEFGRHMIPLTERD